MRLYNNGYPTSSKCSELEYIYEHLSTYVCEYCGRPAKYVTDGWITQLCEKCHKQYYITLTDEERIKQKKHRKNFTVRLIGFSNEGTRKIRYDSKPYWDEYLKYRRVSLDEFLSYVIS